MRLFALHFAVVALACGLGAALYALKRQHKVVRGLLVTLELSEAMRDPAVSIPTPPVTGTRQPRIH